MNIFYKKTFILILISISISLNSCKYKNDPSLRNNSIFYDDEDNKIWRHRVNCLDDAIHYSQIFSGIEIDIYYQNDTKKFICDHGEPCEKVYLSDLIDNIKDYQYKYYWLDFKNSDDKNNVDQAIIALKTLCDKYDIKANIVVESRNPYAVKQFGANDFFTSYWVPHSTNDFTTPRWIKEDIKDVIREASPTALSAHHRMFSYLRRNFPTQALHLWTNGLSGEKDKKRIEKLKDYQNTKVILVDYETPF